VNSLWIENVCNGLSALQGFGAVMHMHELNDADLEAGEQSGKEDDPHKHNDTPPSPEVEPSPPMPEVPSPQPTGPDIAPFQTPPPADPGMPQPEA